MCSWVSACAFRCPRPTPCTLKPYPGRLLQFLRPPPMNVAKPSGKPLSSLGSIGAQGKSHRECVDLRNWGLAEQENDIGDAAIPDVGEHSGFYLPP